jgi:hypothetical protein
VATRLDFRPNVCQDADLLFRANRQCGPPDGQEYHPRRQSRWPSAPLDRLGLNRSVGRLGCRALSGECTWHIRAYRVSPGSRGVELLSALALNRNADAVACLLVESRPRAVRNSRANVVFPAPFGPAMMITFFGAISTTGLSALIPFRPLPPAPRQTTSTAGHEVPRVLAMGDAGEHPVLSFDEEPEWTRTVTSAPDAR